jgi:ABC-type cobalamin transport system ATPase subunit
VQPCADNSRRVCLLHLLGCSWGDAGRLFRLPATRRDDIIPEIDRVILIRNGAVFADGPKTEMLTSAQLSSTFGVPLEVSERDGFYHAG